MKPKETRADQRKGNQQILVDVSFEQLHATVTEVNSYYLKQAVLCFHVNTESWLSVVYTGEVLTKAVGCSLRLRPTKGHGPISEANTSYSVSLQALLGAYHSGRQTH